MKDTQVPRIRSISIFLLLPLDYSNFLLSVVQFELIQCLNNLKRSKLITKSKPVEFVNSYISRSILDEGKREFTAKTVYCMLS